MKEQRILSYLAFQGGGAKGVSHIGSLAAVNELNLEIGGVAGTSAGALIAALVSAGYSAKEIFDCDSGDHILKDLCDGNYADPTKLFSENGWKSIKSIIRWKNRLARYFGLLRSEKGYVSFFAKGGAIAVILLIILFAAVFPLVSLVILACVIGHLAAFLFQAYKGLCSLSNVRKVFDEAICKKLRIDISDVTFGQMKDAGALPLKLVATNTTDSKLELFSYETTPDVAVVDAVCASICIPFVFERWSFLCKRKGEDVAIKKVFIDGGLMSNLPSWSFDEERSLNKEAVTIAFGLEGENSSSFWLMSALDAVIAGPPQIHRRGINRLIHMPIKSSLGVLDFDANFETFKGAVIAAQVEASTLLKFEVTETPVLIRGLLDQLRDEVEQEVFKKYNEERQGTSRRFRVALAIQRPEDHLTLTIAYMIGKYAEAPGIKIALNASTPGMAWQRKDDNTLFFEVFEEKSQSSTKIFSDSAWMLSIPVPVVSSTGEKTKDGLAVVLIIDSPYMLRTDIPRSVIVDYASFLNENMVKRIRAQELGGSVRRSFSWL